MSYQESPHYIDETPGTKYYCTCGESANKPYCDGSHETKKHRQISCGMGSGKHLPYGHLRLR